METCAGNLGSLVNADSYQQIIADTKEPTGFVNRTDSVITFNQISRLFTISPVVDTFSVYVMGSKITISSPLSVTIPNTPGDYYFYINAAGELNYTTTFTTDLITSYAIASFIYWDSANSKYVIFADERHGIVMDGATHSYLHTAFGAQYISGFNIGYILGDGNLDTHMEILLASGVINDEDVRIAVVDNPAPTTYFQQVLSPIAKIPIWYRNNSHWTKTTATNFPMIFGTARAQYNHYNGTTWVLQDAPSNNKVCVTYIFGTNGFTEPVIGILGQAQYQNVAEATALAKWQNIDFGTMPAPEMVLLYTLIYETSTTYNNSVKSRIVSVLDHRYE